MNYPKVVDRKNNVVARHAKGIEYLMKKNKVEWIKGYATLKGGGKVEVKAADGSTQTHDAKNIMIATGSEVGLALDAQKRIEESGRAVRVVSMPSHEYFLKQSVEIAS